MNGFLFLSSSFFTRKWFLIDVHTQTHKQRAKFHEPIRINLFMIVFLLLLLFGLFIYCYHHPLTHSNTMTHYVEEFLSFHLNGLFCHLSERIKTKTKQERKFSSGFFLSVIFSLFFVLFLDPLLLPCICFSHFAICFYGAW